MNVTPSIRVLLIEDDEDVRVGATQVLSLAGLEVESFVSAERARAQISFDVAAVVVCDVRLPGLSGTGWLRELHSLDAELPVILITGHGNIAMAVEAMRDGAYDFIEKPFHLGTSGVDRAPCHRAAATDAAGPCAAGRAGELARHPVGADRPLGPGCSGCAAW